ncbi:MAG: putative two-component system response regulator [Acidimicrobiales bacterium]|nr:putative two-component system response regulator [Acidimicrobiales bacterium]
MRRAVPPTAPPLALSRDGANTEVVVVDGDAMAGECVVKNLATQEGIEVIARVTGRGAAVDTVDRLGPDVVVLDLATLGADAVSTAGALVGVPGRPGLLVLMTVAERTALDVFRAGATGFCTTADSPEALARVVRSVARGEPAMSPIVQRWLLDHVAANGPKPLPSTCTARELEVLVLVAAGATNAEIADRLVVSLATVRTHVQHLRDKLAARSRVELVVKAHECGVGFLRSYLPPR